MIKIKAESKGDHTDLHISLKGSGEEITDEAVHIIMHLPEQIRNANEDLFKVFVKKYGRAIVEEESKK